MMLANPIDEEKDFKRLDANEFQAEYKWDGIRVQLMVSSKVFHYTQEQVIIYHLHSPK